MERNASKSKAISTDAAPIRFSTHFLNFVLHLVHVVYCYSEVCVHIGDVLDSIIS
jgi:hypothetical protein